MLVSIQLNSNRPENIKALVKNVESTSSNPADIEIIFHIDKGDNECKNLLENLKSSSQVKIKFLETDLIKGYKDLWKPLNEILKLTDPKAYFVTNFSDEFRFKTKGWDDVIRKYIGYYEDDIFRIRLSKCRFRSYNDFWECVFAPDSLAFYTKKWLDTVEIWCPCLGPDSWQQLVAYYLITRKKFSRIQYNRDIVEPFLEFEGEQISQGLSKDEAKQRIKDNVELWFETVSYEMQQKAKRAAARLQAAILIHGNYSQDKISNSLINTTKSWEFNNKNLNEILLHENIRHKRINFLYHGKSFYNINYKLNKWKFFFVNNFRKINFAYYVGDIEKYFDKDPISNLNVYFRIKTHGSNLNIKKPEFFKRKNVGFLWPIIKLPLITYKILKTFFTNDRK